MEDERPCEQGRGQGVYGRRDPDPPHDYPVV
jgi:hypothetical protein